MSDRSRFGLRVADSMIPCVEVTDGVVQSGPVRVRVSPEQVVKRCYGFTFAHAYNRALRWSREHGDPR